VTTSIVFGSRTVKLWRRLKALRVISMTRSASFSLRVMTRPQARHSLSERAGRGGEAREGQV